MWYCSKQPQQKGKERQGLKCSTYFSDYGIFWLRGIKLSPGCLSFGRKTFFPEFPCLSGKGTPSKYQQSTIIFSGRHCEIFKQDKPQRFMIRKCLSLLLFRKKDHMKRELLFLGSLNSKWHLLFWLTIICSSMQREQKCPPYSPNFQQFITVVRFSCQIGVEGPVLMDHKWSQISSPKLVIVITTLWFTMNNIFEVWEGFSLPVSCVGHQSLMENKWEVKCLQLMVAFLYNMTSSQTVTTRDCIVFGSHQNRDDMMIQWDAS